MKKLITFTLALSFLAHSGFATETLSNDFVVKITQNVDQTVTFEKCESQNTDRCTVMGPKQKYTNEELKTAQKKLKKLAYLKSALISIPVFIGAFYGFAQWFRVVSSSHNNYNGIIFRILNTNTGFFLSVVAGGTAGFGVTSLIRPLNPIRQFKKANTLSQKTKLQNKDMKQFIELLEESLNTIN